MIDPYTSSILQVERAAEDLRRGLPVILVAQGQEWLLKPGEYEASAGLLLPDHPACCLLKLAGLLPEAVLSAVPEEARTLCLSVTDQAIADYPNALRRSLRKVSEASVPLHASKDARVIAFRPAYGHQEHLAILIGQPERELAPLVRLHSSCLTGDVLGSLRCDCGDQLQQAFRLMQERGSGVVLYLNQEGRGIGIANKLRAYRLQDQGRDTVEANEDLGFLPDERDFALGAEMLRQLGVLRITLITNNPAKIKALAAEGIAVVERAPAQTEPTNENQRYLRAKAEKMGHHFHEAYP